MYLKLIYLENLFHISINERKKPYMYTKEIYLDLSSINEKKMNLLKEISLSFTSGKTLSFH